MATKSVRVCDVFGTSKEVISYRIEIYANYTDTGGAQEGWSSQNKIFDCDIDLGSRGMKRLMKLIERGLRSVPSNTPGLADEAATMEGP